MSESKYTERQPFKTQNANWSFDMALQKWPTVINNQKKNIIQSLHQDIQI